MIEFYLILRAITNISGGVFWRLTIGTLIMLIGGYLGEAGYMNVTVAFIIGMAGWAYILYEIFAGEAGRVAADEAPESVKSAYSTMRWIVTIGWAIYPLGYFFGYMAGGADMATLNIIYNMFTAIMTLSPICEGIQRPSFPLCASLTTGVGPIRSGIVHP